MSSEIYAESHYVPWVSRAAFPIVAGCFYISQLALVISVYKGWIWLSIPLVLLVSHFMHGMLVSFHEASHGTLRKSKLMNEIDGVIVGALSLIGFTLYRVLHQAHHVHLATEKDTELWPYVDPKVPRWKRRFAAFAELTFGFFFTPYLFWRGFFGKNSAIRQKRVRRRIWMELIGMITFWIVVISLVAVYNLWPYLLWNYFLPGFIAGSLQAWRKFIEHMGMLGNTAKSATRSIIADNLAGRAVSVTLLHEPLHGIHHMKGGIPHYELPEHVDLLAPEDERDSEPYPNYRTAIADMLRTLDNPRVGAQWLETAPARA